MFHLFLDKCLKIQVHKMFGSNILKGTTELLFLHFYYHECDLAPLSWSLSDERDKKFHYFKHIVRII